MAPPLADLGRFPDSGAVWQARYFNERHRAWLVRELRAEPSGYRRALLFAWEREALALYRVWDLLADAHLAATYPPWRRRVALKRLRDALGDEAYSRGAMPPCVPVWRFRELRR